MTLFLLLHPGTIGLMCLVGVILLIVSTVGGGMVLSAQRSEVDSLEERLAIDAENLPDVHDLKKLEIAKRNFNSTVRMSLMGIVFSFALIVPEALSPDRTLVALDLAKNGKCNEAIAVSNGQFGPESTTIRIVRKICDMEAK